LSDFFVGVCPTKLRKFINADRPKLNREGIIKMSELYDGISIKKLKLPE
jgi:hypothetical protein